MIRYGLDGPGSNTGGGRDFFHPYRPALDSDLLYHEYRVFFRRVKRSNSPFATYPHLAPRLSVVRVVPVLLFVHASTGMLRVTFTFNLLTNTDFVCFWRNSPTRARDASCSRFLDHTQLHTTVGRTSLDEGSARRKDIYLTTHNIHKSQTSMHPAGSEPAVPAIERP